MNFKICRAVNDNQIVKKYINSGKDYPINTILNLKTKIRFLGQKQKLIKIHKIIFEMFFRVQAQVFLQVVILQAPSSILVS